MFDYAESFGIAMINVADAHAAKGYETLGYALPTTDLLLGDEKG